VKSEPVLERTVGLLGAVGFGLGAMIGTGVFVYTGIAAGLAGPAMLVSLGIAGAAAAANGLSSAQLAMIFPRSGGTYEYAGRLLAPWAGFMAGWLFLAAKTASAAATALGFGAYIGPVIGAPPVVVSLTLAAAIVALDLYRLKGAGTVNLVLVSMSVLALGLFVGTGLGEVKGAHFSPFAPHGIYGTLSAASLLFVAFAGYGRVATLGEEIKDPRRNIPRAVVLSLIGTTTLYILVSWVAIGTVGAEALAEAAKSGAPLERAAAGRGVRMALAIGAATAMGAVFLNLMLGLSRMAFAMGRTGDLPGGLAKVNRYSSPYVSVVFVGLVVGTLIAIGNLVGLVSLSAFTVLAYYGITNLSALRIRKADRWLPMAIPSVGLVFCLGLAATVPVEQMLPGVAVAGAGALWWFARRLAGQGPGRS
jgi:basic amino acid/polyamine antiporter, APA family